MLDLNELIDRSGTSSVKWEFIFEGEQLVYGDHAHQRHGANRILPLWVADMDFAAPQAVIDAITARAQHGVYGYSAPTDSYFEAVIGWSKRRHGWQIQREWISILPGVVPAIHLMVKAFVAPGEKVLIQQPVYYPFMAAIENNGAEIVSNSLLYENGRYQIDFADLADKAADPAVKMLILCSPHNPVSRVWTPAELTRLGEICLANDLLVIADEIHCDLLFPGVTFTPFASLSEQFAQNSITCIASSKTFNLAGLKTSNILIPNETLRTRYTEMVMSCGLWGTNAFGLVATEAAYNFGAEWLDNVMAYINENYHFMKSYLAEHIPQIKLVEPEGTYLIWADCSALGIDCATRKELFLGEAKVFLLEGRRFGPEGEDFERFNIACPRAVLAEALDRLRAAIATRPDLA